MLWKKCFFHYCICATSKATKSLQSCLTLWQTHRQQPTRLPHPWDSPGKNTGVGCHFFSNAWKWKVKVKSLSCVRLLATPWTASYQAPLPMGFSRQEYWSGLPLKALCKNYALSRVFIQQKLTLHFLYFWAFAGCWILFLKKNL